MDHPLPDDIVQFRAFMRRLMSIAEVVGWGRPAWVYEACLRLQVIWGETWDEGQQGRQEAAEARRRLPEC